MRITTSMLNETAKKTGIPINQNNLLSYLNNDEGVSDNTLLDALNKNNKVSSKATENYKKLEKSADRLKDAAQKLTADGEQSLYDKIRNSEEADKPKHQEELYSGIGSFLEQYNATLSELDKNAGPMNSYYKQMLKDTAKENSKALEDLGVTADEDGRLSLDMEKLKNASVDDIEKVFGKTGTFAVKSSILAERISDNAQVNAESYSSQYSAFGSLQSQIASKFDFWG